MYTVNLITLIIAGLACLLALITLFQQISWRRQDSFEEQSFTDSKKLHRDIEKISDSSRQHYHYLREHLLDTFDFFGNLIQEFACCRDNEDIKTQLKKHQSKNIIRLRKIELSSISSETQREALMYFAGSPHGRNLDVIEYVQLLYKRGDIDKNNKSLALRIIGGKQVN